MKLRHLIEATFWTLQNGRHLGSSRLHPVFMDIYVKLSIFLRCIDIEALLILILWCFVLIKLKTAQLTNRVYREPRIHAGTAYYFVQGESKNWNNARSIFLNFMSVLPV